MKVLSRKRKASWVQPTPIGPVPIDPAEKKKLDAELKRMLDREAKTAQKNMVSEIRRQCAEWDKQYEVDLNALALYVLRVHLGFGPKRLRRFFKAFSAEHKALREHYLMDSPEDGHFLARRELLKIGVDVEAWTKEDEDA